MVTVVFSIGKGSYTWEKHLLATHFIFMCTAGNLTKELVHTSQVYWTTSPSSSLPTTLNFSTNALSVGKYTK